MLTLKFSSAPQLLTLATRDNNSSNKIDLVKMKGGLVNRLRFGDIVIQVRKPPSLTHITGILFKRRGLKVIVFGRREGEWVLPSCSGHRDVFHGPFSSRVRYCARILEAGSASSYSAVSVARCSDMEGSRLES